jgi:hypothetical protein
MVDQNSPFSFNIRQAFLDYIIEHVEKSNFTIEENILPIKIIENE